MIYSVQFILKDGSFFTLFVDEVLKGKKYLDLRYKKKNIYSLFIRKIFDYHLSNNVNVLIDGKLNNKYKFYYCAYDDTLGSDSIRLVFELKQKKPSMPKFKFDNGENPF